ncbi:MAG: penicillin acylase family protein [Anaerolineae bacterium]|nr:penicillin acylase family protein [Anaerolineae bacterium]
MSISHAAVGWGLRAGLKWLGRRRLPQVDGVIRLAALEAPVEIIRDRWGMPHIYAADLHDLFFAHGFVHAQDRLWQMELNRRVGAGRLSEIFGPVALDTDRFSRTFGFSRLAAVDVDTCDERLHALLQAYADGVNQFLARADGRLPVEFALLRYRPEPWTLLDSLTWSRVMMWTLSHAWFGELVRARLIEQVGPERAAELEIRYPERHPLTLPQGIEFNRLTVDGMLQAAQGPFLQQAFGSNSWAVSAARTNTGSAMLCCDMHLPLQLPSIWHAAHLVAGADGEQFHVSGVSLPGVPLVLVGHNARIAWGATLAFTDCEDLYVERFHPVNPYHYEVEGDWQEAQVIHEVIQVKGRDEPHVEEVVVTRHGPVISDVVGATGQRLAVKSMALQPADVFEGWYRLNTARGWDDFVTAMRGIAAPQLNVPYADVEGNIGYWITGRVPVRAKGQGLVPAPGWNGEYEWVGEVPFAEMPHALNPVQGYVISCNHRIVPDDYPHYLGSVWMNGYRARRLVDVFEERGVLTQEDFRALHVDVHSLPGLEFARRLDGLAADDPRLQEALEQLRAWDGELSAGSVAGALYEVTLQRLIHNLWQPRLGPDLLYQLLGKGAHPLLHHASEFYGHATVTVLAMLDDPESVWVREAGGREALLLRSVGEAVNWLEERLGPDMAGWQWGKIHQLTFPHAMAVQPPLDRVFNLGPYPIGGDTDTVCQTAYHAEAPYVVNAWAPSYRQIVDLGDLDRSLMIHPPGQSGQLTSPHYDDLVEMWLAGEYVPMLWTRERVEEAAEGRLRLEPEE